LKAGEISEHDIFEPWDVVFAFQTFQRDPFWFLNSAVFSSGEEQQLVQIGQLFLGAVGSESPSNFKHRNIRRTPSWVVVEPFPYTLQIPQLSIKVNWDQRPAFGDGESSYFHQPGLLLITTHFCWLTSSPLLVKINIFHHLSSSFIFLYFVRIVIQSHAVARDQFPWPRQGKIGKINPCVGNLRSIRITVNQGPDSGSSLHANPGGMGGSVHDGGGPCLQIDNILVIQ
jgi:hypothetical protein